MIRKSALQRILISSVICGAALAAFGISWAADPVGVTGQVAPREVAAKTQGGLGPNPGAETKDGYYYTVQKGDTLWDLSRRFADSPWVWPELWTENSSVITNPHLIYPGQKIRLTRKAGVPPQMPTEAEKHLQAHIHYFYSLIDQVGFIRRVPVAPQAVIFQKPVKSTNMISQGNIVYLKPEGNAALEPGSLFTIYRTFDPLYDTNTKELIGTQHLLLGLVQVTERQPEYAIGKVLKSYRPIVLFDKLMPYTRRDHHIPLKDSQEGINGMVMMSELHLNMFAEFNTAFIDRGRIHGIQEGQIYSLYLRDENQLGSGKSAKTITIPVNCGELLVLHVEDANSTVLITNSTHELFAGTLLRTPLPVP
jgi:LysM repeat protein